MFVTMWLPETISFIFFPGQRVYPAWVDAARQVLGMIWPMAIMVMGIPAAEKIKWYAGLAITAAAGIPMTVLMVIFVR